MYYSITPDKESTDVIVPEKDPLASVRYSCEFWVDHLSQTLQPVQKMLFQEGKHSFIVDILTTTILAKMIP
jgi:hypothetical protein